MASHFQMYIDRTKTTTKSLFRLWLTVEKITYFLLGVADIQFHGGTLVQSVKTSATHK